MLAGRPLIAWAAARLRFNCDRVAASVRPGTDAERIATAEGLALLHDEPGDALGPLAGIKVGLKWAIEIGATQLAVSPCDAPLLPDDLYARLLAGGGGRAAMAETEQGPQPLCAVWPVSALAVVDASLANGAHPSLWRLLDSIGAVRVRFDDAGAFANVNTPADLETVIARFLGQASNQS